MILTAVLFLAIFTFENVYSGSSSVRVETPGVPYHLVLDLDTVADFQPTIQDDEVNSIEFGIEFSSSEECSVTFSFFKNKEKVFTSNTTSKSSQVINFHNEWIEILLNGTYRTVDSSNESRRLDVVVLSECLTEGTFTSQKVILEEKIDNTGYPMNISIHLNDRYNDKIIIPLKGILELVHSKSAFPVILRSNSPLSFEIGVCNSTFITIVETEKFHGAFLETEKPVISLMKNVHCFHWNENTDNYFIRSISGNGTLIIEASFEDTTNLLDNDEALKKFHNKQ